jgi:two-component sensor histidine kinase
VSIIADISSASRHASAADDLLLRETNHRCSNDLQLVVSLLALQSRRAASVETREALSDAMERVSVLARSRAALNHQSQHSLGAALLQTCEALHAQCEPRSILLSLELATEGRTLSPSQITTLAFVVNELATNAIKHAFEVDVPGHISIKAHERDARSIVVIVDDDGLPFPELEGDGTGLGLGLIKRLVASIDGVFISPPPGTKTFEIRLPLKA